MRFVQKLLPGRRQLDLEKVRIAAIRVVRNALELLRTLIEPLSNPYRTRIRRSSELLRKLLPRSSDEEDRYAPPSMEILLPC